MSCPCDQPSPTPVADIAPGLTDLPRQLFGFGDLKLAMLDRARLQPALADWRARASDDYGVMWLEMMAYLGELLSLYDKAIADESYVRTAKLRPSLRRLLEVLGYVPRPAVAATVELALIADGAAPLDLPVGTGFRSGAFGSEPPQVFEMVAPATIHPALDRWPVVIPPATWFNGSIGKLLLDPATAQIAIDDVVLIEMSPAPVGVAGPTGRDIAQPNLGALYKTASPPASGAVIPVPGLTPIVAVRKVTAVARTVDAGGRRVVDVTLDLPIPVGDPMPVSGVRVLKPTRTASLKSPQFANELSYAQTGPKKCQLILDGIYREVNAADLILVSYKGTTRSTTVVTRTESAQTVQEASKTTAYDIKNGTTVLSIPAVTIPAVTGYFTVLIVTVGTEWFTPTDAEGFTVGVGLVSAGKVLGPLMPAVTPAEPLALIGARLPVGSTASTSRVILRDAEQRGVAVGGGVNLATGVLTLDSTAAWSSPLATPLTAYGNVVTAVRGETVASEVLGSGDASAVMQRFTLKKKPLTYQSVAGSGGDAGVVAALRVWVDGLLWTEVTSFYGQGRDAQVYIVRQGDDEASTVIFGDGVRGARLPTGVDNLIASYRWGAGEASPPAGSIAQLARPVPGLSAVIGPLGASGGEDAEDATSLRELAPRSALLLGRAISIDDMQVAALMTPGVVAARAEWSWDLGRQRAVVKVWVVGTQSVVDATQARLQAVADPETPIAVAPATPVIPSSFVIDLELDPRRVATTVLAAAKDAMLGEDGWLTPARLGVATPLLRSPLIARLLEVPGVTGVRGLKWNGAALLDYGVDPGVGNYFDLTATSVIGS